MHVMIAGAGWLGRAIGRALVARGDRVTAVRRSALGHAELRADGLEPLAADLALPSSIREIPTDIEAIVACQAASSDSVEAYRHAYVDVNRSLLAAAERLPLRAYVYTGSTGVFGQSDGSDVDETTPVAPDGDTAEVLVEAESLVLAAAANRRLPTRLVRLSGLYGPQRTGLIDRVKRGLLALGPSDATWMNFCHRDDAVALVLAALDRGGRGSIYHGSDAFPTRRRDVVTWIAGRLGIEPPVRRLEDASPGRRGADRRILGVATRRELGLALVYPSFREGLEPFLLQAFES